MLLEALLDYFLHLRVESPTEPRHLLVGIQLLVGGVVGEWHFPALAEVVGGPRTLNRLRHGGVHASAERDSVRTEIDAEQLGKPGPLIAVIRGVLPTLRAECGDGFPIRAVAFTEQEELFEVRRHSHEIEPDLARDQHELLLAEGHTLRERKAGVGKSASG